MGLSSHQTPVRGKNDEWLTPPEIIESVGPFDLDPCAPVVRPWSTAAEHFTVEDDGLSLPWHGFVWCNPPFSQAAAWLERMADHRHGIALIAARTETRSFFANVWGRAEGVLFLRGRPHFHYVDGQRAPFNSGAPICLIAYGAEADRRLSSSVLGQYVRPAPEEPR